MPTIGTLCYVIKYGKVLLIRKKKGLGMGLWNGPGGKVENGEAIVDAAKREVYEEVCIVPEAPAKVGEMHFHFPGGAWNIHVFKAHDFDGIERETDEAAPKWFRLDKIPYDDMWPDDRIWMPLMLQGKKFVGTFHLDGSNNLLGHEIREVDGFDGSVV